MQSVGEFKLVPVKFLDEPDQPDRKDSIMENMEELVNDIRSNGLMNPICVEELSPTSYRVFAGHRRSIAVTILQMEQVMCHVFPAGHPAIERMKASENMKRNQLTESEEALVYKRVHEREGQSPQDIAMYFDRPVQRVLDLIDLANGDPRVFDLLGRGEISRAQALEINRFKTEPYRLAAIEQAVKHGLKAPGLKRWRQGIEDYGGEVQLPSPEEILRSMAPGSIDEPHQICMFGNHSALLRHSKHYIICSEHWDLVIQGLEALNRERAAKNGAEGTRAGETGGHPRGVSDAEGQH